MRSAKQGNFLKLRSKPSNLTSKNAWWPLLFILPNESNKPIQQTINFWFGENVIYTIFKANAWRRVTADNFLVVLVFKKRTYKEQLLCYHLLLILKPSYNYHFICSSSRVRSEIWGKKQLFIIFLKNAHSAFFSILERSYLWKMRGYPQFSFWISIAPDMIYLSHIVIIWEFFPRF